MIDKESIIRMQVERIYPKQLRSKKLTNIVFCTGVGYIIGTIIGRKHK